MSRQVGSFAEQLALQHLINRGHSLIACNYTCRGGEIDLISLDNDCLVFNEVKARKSCNHGHPAEFVDRHKQQKIIFAAKNFLNQQPIWHTYPMRFDVIAIYLDNQSIEIIEDAFTL